MRRMFVIAFALSLSPLAEAVTVTGYDQTSITIENPKRIVAINPTTTEIIFALGEGARIVGVDAGAQFPAAVEKIEKVGHPYRPSVEGMISLKPDLVIATEENLPPASVQQLRSAKVPVLILEASDKGGIEGYKRRVTTIAEVLGQKEKGQAEIARFTAAIKKVEDKVRAGAKTKPKVFFFYAHGPASGRIYGNATGPHYLIEAAGGANVFQSCNETSMASRRRC